MGFWEAIRVGDTWFLEHRIELESPAVDGTAWMSSDGRTAVLSSIRAGNGTDDLYIATR